MDQRFRQNINPAYADIADILTSLPERFARGEGTLIYEGRNQLRRFEVGQYSLVVKSFRIPNLLNRMVYGRFRSSKAQRSYEYAAHLRSIGIGSPEPVAWITEHRGLLLGHSYYVCLESELPYTYKDIIAGQLDTDLEHRALAAIATTTARLHDHGIIHKDYSRGNILFGPLDDGSISVEIIDLNRIRFRPVSIDDGLANLFERLPVTADQRRIVETAYREARG